MSGIDSISELFSGVFTSMVVAIIIVLMGFIIGKMVGRLIQKALHEFKFDDALKKSAGINFSVEHLVGSFITYIIYFVTLVIALNQLGLTTIILNIISGALIFLVVISILLALRDFVPNLVASIYIYQRGLIKKGSIISFDKIKAKVVETNIVETRLESSSKDIIHVPNSLLLKKILKVKKS
jgi:small-conductance mechanosensitive channel